jgi:hypothetical protein
MKKLFLLAIVALGFTAVSFGQPFSALAKANAKVLSSLSIVKGTTDLNFGSFIPNATTPGTVTIDAILGGRTSTIITEVTSLIPPSPATFIVASDAGSIVYIYPPTGTLQLIANGGGAGNTMTVGTWKINVVSPFTMLSGSLALQVGGTLTVNAGQNPGTYVSSDFVVTVAYN